MFGLLLLLGFAACLGNPSALAPCFFPMEIDNTGECDSGLQAARQFGPEQMFDREQ